MLEQLKVYVQKKVAAVMHKIIEGKGEHTLIDHFIMSSYKGQTQSRRLRSEFERNTSSFRVPVLWNALPDIVKDARNVQNVIYEQKHKAISELSNNFHQRNHGQKKQGFEKVHISFKI